jgi:hypothetical protein
MKTLIPNIWVFDLIIQQKSHWCNNNETFVRYHPKKRLYWCEASVWQFAPVHSTGTLMMIDDHHNNDWHLIRSNSWFYSSHCITMTIKTFIHHNCLSFLLEAYGRKRWTQFMSMLQLLPLSYFIYSWQYEVVSTKVWKSVFMFFDILYTYTNHSLICSQNREPSCYNVRTDPGSFSLLSNGHQVLFLRVETGQSETDHSPHLVQRLFNNV